MFGGGRCFIWGDCWKDFGFGEVEAVWGWKVFYLGLLEGFWVWGRWKVFGGGRCFIWGDCWKDLGFGEVEGVLFVWDCWKDFGFGGGGRCLEVEGVLFGVTVGRILGLGEVEGVWRWKVFYLG